jgi:hypothetical protein
MKLKFSNLSFKSFEKINFVFYHINAEKKIMLFGLKLNKWKKISYCKYLYYFRFKKIK